MSLLIQRQGPLLRVATHPSAAWLVIPAVLILPVFWFFCAWFTVELVRRPEGRVDATIYRHRLLHTSPAVHVPDVRAVRLDSVVRHEMVHDQPRNRPGVRVTINQHVRTRLYQVRLRDAAGNEHPIAEGRDNSEKAHRQLADGIERFLADSTATRTVLRRAWDPLTLLLLIFGLIGPLIFSLGRSECVIDGRTGRVRLTAVCLPGFGTREFPLSEVREFEVRLRPSAGDNPPAARPVLVRMDGREIGLALCWTAGADGALTAVNALERKRMEFVHAAADRTSAAPVPEIPPAVRPPLAAPTETGPEASPTPVDVKICVICGEDCSGAPRGRDEQGRYYHQSCYLLRK